MARPVAVVIPVRLGSTRLPRKHLADAGGKPMLRWLLERQIHGLAAHGLVAEIVVATTTDAEDDEADAVATTAGCRCYRGVRENVPARLAAAARSVGGEAFVSVDGDDIACAPEAVAAVAGLLHAGAAIVGTEGWPFGMNASGFRCDVVERAMAGSEGRVVETGWGRFIDGARVRVVFPVDDVDGLRFTLDYPQDGEFFRRLIGLAGERFVSAPSSDLIAIAREHRLASINASLDQEYWEYYRRQIDHESSPSSPSGPPRS